MELSEFLLFVFSLFFLELLAQVPRTDRKDFANVFLLELFLSLFSALCFLSTCSSWLSSSISLSLSNCDLEARDGLRLCPNEMFFDDVSTSTPRSTDCVLDRVRYAIKSLQATDELCPSPAVFFDVAGVTLLECAVELVAKDDEYEEEVELEKLRRRRFVFLLVEVAGISSSVSSSVVLFNRMFRSRFLGVLILLLATVEVAVVVFDDEDVSDLRFFIAKNRNFVSEPLRYHSTWRR